MKGKSIIRIAIALVVVLVAVAVVVLLGAQSLNEATDTIPADGAVFTVEKGEYLDSISARLADAGLIRSRLFLKALSYLKGTQSEFQVGSYRIEPGTTTLGIHDLLVSGKEILVRVTIPEGFTASRIAERLESDEITTSKEFLDAVKNPDLLTEFDIPGDSAEGYLFPDTYLFPKHFPAVRVVEVMISTFYQSLQSIYPDYEKIDRDTLHDRVVLASIIEREYRDPDEAAVMASVFYNRLAAHMRLQSCATVAYVMTEELGMAYPEVLTYEDLELPSPYNTYANAGLPPGPIANPGATALHAVFYPAKSDYLFFVLKDPSAGRHEFTKSYSEHINAKNLYLKQS